MQTRRYNLELAASLVLYGVLLFASLAILKRAHLPPVWQAPISLSPMCGGLVMAWVIHRQVRRIDEMQRKLLFEVLCLSFAGTALITFSYGFLELVGYPRLSMFVVWPLMATLWIVIGAASAWLNRM